ncbi:relaxase/mobilization nuclease domain-containing protein [Bosea sp. (in: a-proteobacteria)]|uniref:relaxase/mobilization nuclease domain-containing protein n=1 Tax=Bosea sp. (in: a-proteobacteria) TaxID=1871050 RepID=UPI004034EF1B
MIIKASQRAGGKALAVHLMRDDENDHVEVHEVRGFVGKDVESAFREAYAISKGTRCRQFLFSCSFNPPEGETATVQDFERAIAITEERLGLTGQPRVLVFHEKNGRRHAHCVWSRIRADEMRAVNMSHFKMKLRDLARELFIEHGWKMPRGLVNSEERNPLNFSREEWQQAKRINRDPRTIKTVFQDCWAISDSANAFVQAMEARGYYVARGDRRAFVALDHTGEIYAIARWADVRTKKVNDRLGDPEKYPTVEQVKERLAQAVGTKLKRFAAEAKAEFDDARLGLQDQKRKLVAWQRHERKIQMELQAVRQVEEARARYAQFSKSWLKGIWDRITGRHAAIRRENEAELARALERDRLERQALIERQLHDRRSLQLQIRHHQDRLERELQQLQEPASKPTLKPELQQHLAAKPQRTRRRRDPAPT